MRKTISCVTVLGLIALGCATADGAANDAASGTIEITKQPDADALDVIVNGEHFTTYHYSNDNRKPFLWPVYAEGGVTVTRNWPMGEDEKESKDHVHQKSIWTAYGEVNGVDLWGEGENSGYQYSEEVTFGSEGSMGWIRANNIWQDKDHNPVVTEERKYRFYAAPASARCFDATITFTASEGDVTFGDTKEGGMMSFRIRPQIQMTGGTGTITLKDVAGYPRCWGQPSPWCDYSGELDGVGVRGIAVFDHPSNLRHPTRWHVRDYGLCGANCFGLSYFTEREMKKQGKEPLNGNYVLENGKSLTFNYRVIIHSGDVQEAKIAKRYEDYAKTPALSVAH